jgi:transposase
MSQTPKLTPRAAKKLQAAQLLAGGDNLEHVAEAVGLSLVSVKRYQAILSAEGLAAFERVSVGGRKSALDDQARAWIVEAVRGSPRRHGFDTDQWSNPALQAVIERQFGERFSIVYVRQLTINLGVHDRMRSFRAPMRRAPGILDAEALSWITAALTHSARLHDFDSDLWTNERLRTIIERKFGVRYSRGHAWQIATDLGLSHLLSPSRK